MSENSNYIQSRESQAQINETSKKNSSSHRKLRSLNYVCLMLFSLGTLMNVRLSRRNNRSSLSSKSVRFIWKRSNSVKTVLK